MNSSSLCNRIRFAVHFLKPSNGVHSPRRTLKFSTSFTNPLAISEATSTLIYRTLAKSHKRNVSSSNLAKSNDSDTKSDENPGKVTNRNALADEDFQNILKDFAKDFGLGGDSAELLEDIKKQLNDETDSGKQDSSATTKLDDSEEKLDTAAAIKNKFKEFSESDAVIINSFEEERYGVELPYHIDQETDSMSLQYDTKRGVSGVFDIDQLVPVLNGEKLLDIAVISVPKDLHYTDFLILTTARSPRHAEAVAEFLIKLYKKKRSKADPLINVEGQNVSNWKAIDFGNIVLHIFLEETRKFYDIESLWLFDNKFDTGGTLLPDPLFDAIKEQMAFFNAIQDVPTDEAPKDNTNS